MGYYGKQMIFIAELDFPEYLLNRILNDIRILKVDGFQDGVKQIASYGPFGERKYGRA